MRRGAFVPVRAQAVLALLERLKHDPSLSLPDHLVKAGSAIVGHETLGKAAHERLKLEPINKNHGRRSSNIHDWGPPLLAMLEATNFETASQSKRNSVISDLQDQIASPLRALLADEPISVRTRGRSAESVIAEILSIADSKGKAGPVAQYLVGAKLQLRFPDQKDRILIVGSNRGDRKSRSDESARRGDYDLGEYVFEVAVGLPDTKHLDQIQDVLDDPAVEMWLLVRSDRLAFWQGEVRHLDIDSNRIVIASIELFVGQNVTELGGMKLKSQMLQLEQLFDIYNTEWMPTVGSESLRIVVK